MNSKSIQKIVVGPDESGLRLDRYLMTRITGKSRQYLQNLIKNGHIKVNQKPGKAGQTVNAADSIEIYYPQLKTLALAPKDLNLKIVYEDVDLIVIDKPPGMVVHPGNNNAHMEDSMVNAILYHAKGKLSGINGVMRPGIVHRLDKDTSGLIVVAKNDMAHNYLADQFKNHTVEKKYYALVSGIINGSRGIIDSPIGRDFRDRKRMAVVRENTGRNAITRFEVVERIKKFCLLNVSLLTGRTHQIRVHLSSIGCPLAGDKVYGNAKINAELEKLCGLNRQFLHSYYLKLKLPSTKKEVEFKSGLPKDLQDVMRALKN